MTTTVADIMDGLATRAQVAEVLGLSERTVARITKAGHLPRIKLGERRILYRVDAVREYLAGREQRIGPRPR